MIYYDQRGQGRSELLSDGKKLGYEQHVADLEALRVHFKLERMSLIGNSWGGLLISLYAVAHPDRIERMILDARLADGRLHGRYGGRDQPPDGKDLHAQQIARLKTVRDPKVWLRQRHPTAICREFYYGVLRVYNVFADVRRQI